MTTTVVTCYNVLGDEDEMKRVYKKLYEKASTEGFCDVNEYLADEEKKNVMEKLDKDFSRVFILGMPIFVRETPSVPEQK